MSKLFENADCVRLARAPKDPDIERVEEDYFLSLRMHLVVRRMLRNMHWPPSDSELIDT